MNAALDKLKKDIWEDEIPQETEGTGRDKKSHIRGSTKTLLKPKRFHMSSKLTVNPSTQRVRHVSPARKAHPERKQTQEQAQQKDDKAEDKTSEKAPSDILEVLEPTGQTKVTPISQILHMPQQTAVSQIRRQIFDLPVSEAVYCEEPKENAKGQRTLTFRKLNQSTTIPKLDEKDKKTKGGDKKADGIKDGQKKGLQI